MGVEWPCRRQKTRDHQDRGTDLHEPRSPRPISHGTPVSVASPNVCRPARAKNRRRTKRTGGVRRVVFLLARPPVVAPAGMWWEGSGEIARRASHTRTNKKGPGIALPGPIEWTHSDASYTVRRRLRRRKSYRDWAADGSASRAPVM